MFQRITPVVRNLLLINIVLTIVQSLFHINLIALFGLRYMHAVSFNPFQFFTYMFIHAGFWHLFGNMLALFIFGPMLEQVWGSRRFLAFYLICGVGAGTIWFGVNFLETYPIEKAATEYAVHPNPEAFNSFVVNHYQLTDNLEQFIDQYANNPDNDSYKVQSVNFVQEMYQRIANTPMVGASGAVFGLLLAFGMLFPNTVLMLLIPPIPIKAKYFVLFYGLFELYSTIQQAPGDNVAHFAHLGGMLFAFILLKKWGMGY